MEKRTNAFLQAGYFLSRFRFVIEGTRYPLPPKRLNAARWNVAYRMFYDSLGGGRTVIAFERSLKNTRDEFDAHFPESGRIGWRSSERSPRRLGAAAQQVIDQFHDKTEEEVWEVVA